MTKVPLKVSQSFKKVVQPKLDNEDAVDMSSYSADLAPKLEAYQKAYHDTTYEALWAEARDIYVSYNGVNLQALVELRTKENCIRVMLTVSTPADANVCQAGSYAFQVLKTGNVTKQAYLYMDMLRILTMIGDHKQADLALIKNCHTQVKTYLDTMMAED